jgi:hypothetical protein
VVPHRQQHAIASCKHFRYTGDRHDLGCTLIMGELVMFLSKEIL